MNHYYAKIATLYNNTLTIECMNGYTPGTDNFPTIDHVFYQCNYLVVYHNTQITSN